MGSTQKCFQGLPENMVPKIPLSVVFPFEFPVEIAIAGGCFALCSIKSIFCCAKEEVMMNHLVCAGALTKHNCQTQPIAKSTNQYNREPQLCLLADAHAPTVTMPIYVPCALQIIHIYQLSCCTSTINPRFCWFTPYCTLW